MSLVCGAQVNKHHYLPEMVFREKKTRGIATRPAHCCLEVVGDGPPSTRATLAVPRSVRSPIPWLLRPTGRDIHKKRVDGPPQCDRSALATELRAWSVHAAMTNGKAAGAALTADLNPNPSCRLGSVAKWSAHAVCSAVPGKTVPIALRIPMSCPAANWADWQGGIVRRKWWQRGPAHWSHAHWRSGTHANASQSFSSLRPSSVTASTNRSEPTGVPRIFTPSSFQTSGPKSSMPTRSVPHAGFACVQLNPCMLAKFFSPQIVHCSSPAWVGHRVHVIQER